MIKFWVKVFPTIFTTNYLSPYISLGFADFREELKNATEDMKAAYLTNFNALMASLEEIYGKSMEKNMQSFKSSMLQNIRGPRQNPFQDMLQALKCEKDGALPSLSWLTS